MGQGGFDGQLEHLCRTAADPGVGLALDLRGGDARQREGCQRVGVYEAVQLAAADGGPFAPHGVDRGAGPRGQRGPGRAGIVGALVQPGLLLQAGGGDGLGVGGGLRPPRLSPGFVAQRFPAQADAGIVVFQYRLAGQALAGHGLGAALAHAHAAALAAEGDLKGLVAAADPHGLVVLVVDAQVVPLLQRAVGGHAHRHAGDVLLAVCIPDGDGQREVQRAIEAAGRVEARVFGLYGLDGGDPRALGVQALLAQGVGHARVEGGLQAGVQARGVPAQRGGLLRAAALQVVGIVHDRAVGQRRVEGVGRGFRLAAVGIAEVAGGGAVAVAGDLAPGLVHGLHHVGVLRGVAVAPEAEGVAGIGQVVARAVAGRFALQGVVAGHDGLGLQRFDAAGGGHFVAHDAVQVILDVDAQHRGDGVAGGGQEQVAAEAVGEGGGGKGHARVPVSRAQPGGRAQAHAAAPTVRVRLPAWADRVSSLPEGMRTSGSPTRV